MTTVERPPFPVDAWHDEAARTPGPRRLRAERIYDSRSGEYGYEAQFRRYRAMHPLRRVAIAMLRDLADRDGVEVER